MINLKDLQLQELVRIAGHLFSCDIYRLELQSPNTLNIFLALTSGLRTSLGWVPLALQDQDLGVSVPNSIELDLEHL